MSCHSVSQGDCDSSFNSQTLDSVTLNLSYIVDCDHDYPESYGHCFCNDEPLTACNSPTESFMSVSLPNEPDNIEMSNSSCGLYSDNGHELTFLGLVDETIKPPPLNYEPNYDYVDDWFRFVQALDDFNLCPGLNLLAYERAHYEHFFNNISVDVLINNIATLAYTMPSVEIPDFRPFEDFLNEPFQNQSTAPAVPTGGLSTMAPCDSSQSVVPEAVTAVAPMETTGMIQPAVAAGNVLDPWFYEHYVHLTRFAWSTTTPPGTLLWSSPIAPQYAHNNLAYVSKLYNVWAGGLDYNVAIAGTGFHAGKLVIVRLPPNISPTTIQAVTDFTIFDYVILDVKTLEVFSKSVVDQRRFLFHYRDTNVDESSINFKDNIGGYVAIYVLLQLSASSTGVHQIDVEVLNKAALDFSVAQMRPVDLTQVIETYNSYESFLDPQAKACHGIPFLRNNMDTIVALPNNTVNGFGMCQIDGSNLNNVFPAVPSYRDNGIPSNALVKTGQSLSNTEVYYKFPIFTENTNLNQYFLLNPTQNLYAACKPGNIDGIARGIFIYPGACPSFDSGFSGNHWTLPDFMNACKPGPGQKVEFNNPLDVASAPISLPYYANFIYTTTGVPVSPPNASESFFCFQTFATTSKTSDNPFTYYLQSTHITDLIFSGVLPKFPRTSALLFNLVDIITNEPVLPIKLYFEGFFTTRKVNSIVEFKLSNYKLQFVGIVQRNSPLPIVNSSHFLDLKQEQWQQRLQDKLRAQRLDLSPLSLMEYQML